MIARLVFLIFWCLKWSWKYSWNFNKWLTFANILQTTWIGIQLQISEVNGKLKKTLLNVQNVYPSRHFKKVFDNIDLHSSQKFQVLFLNCENHLTLTCLSLLKSIITTYKNWIWLQRSLILRKYHNKDKSYRRLIQIPSCSKGRRKGINSPAIFMFFYKWTIPDYIFLLEFSVFH